MTHFILLIIVPYHIYIKGSYAVDKYIQKMMSPYYEDLIVEPYISMTKSELITEYENFKKSESYDVKYDTIEKYCLDYCGYENFDEQDNVLSTYNKQCFWDCYTIGGRWDGDLTDSYCSSVGTLKHNSIQITDFLKKYISDKKTYTYHHVIDQEGHIHKDRDIGWFGTYDQTTNEQEWSHTFEDLLNKQHNDFLVGLDCHI